MKMIKAPSPLLASVGSWQLKHAKVLQSYLLISNSATELKPSQVLEASRFPNRFCTEDGPKRDTGLPRCRCWQRFL